MKSRNFYILNNRYLDYLRQFDNKVPLMEYEDYDKFFFGKVMINEFEYYVPISSFNRQQRTNLVIKNKRNEPISSIRFCFMIPVAKHLSSVVVSNLTLEDDQDPYLNLVSIEEHYCIEHNEIIQGKAKFIYERVEKRHPSYYPHCCNFKRLEIAASNTEEIKKIFTR